MSGALRLRDCFGFHKDALKRCHALKYGMRAFSDPSSDDWLSSCSIIVGPNSTPESIAVCGSRIPRLIGRDLPIGKDDSSHCAIILDELGLLNSSAFCMAALGCLLFREAERVVVVPPVLNPSELLNEASEVFRTVNLPKQALIKKVFGSIEKATEYLQVCMLSLFLRDLSRSLEAEGRPPPKELVALAESNRIALDSVDSLVNELKPELTSSSIQNEWHSVVDALYDRPPIPRGFTILRPEAPEFVSSVTPDNQSRQSSRKRSYKDLLRLEMSSDSGSDSDASVVKVKATKKKPIAKVVQTEPVMEFDNWLQCDECSKWRKVDAATVARFEDASFACTDVSGKSCSDPSDS